MSTEIASPAQNEPKNPAPLDIISSDNAAEIDDGIRKRWFVNVKGNSIYVDGHLAVIIGKKTDRRVYEYFREVVHTACEALSAEGFILPVFLRNRREVRRIGPVIEQAKIKMRG